MQRPTLSIVVPVYNEALVLRELVDRCTAAGEETGLPFELLIVDDASSDDTSRLLSERHPDARLRCVRLAHNVGQFRATQAGLRQARGDWIAVLDGDLQDPPEAIPLLVQASLRADPGVAAILAVKAQRDDALPFMTAQFAFHVLQSIFSRVRVPRGAGSFCLMRSTVAARVCSARLQQANLASVAAVVVNDLGARLRTVPYTKQRRYDESSHVGWRRLVAEAMTSLAVTGALPRAMILVAVVTASIALCWASAPTARIILSTVSTLALIGSRWWSHRIRQALRTSGAVGETGR